MQDREEISFLSVRNPNSFLPVRSTIVSSRAGALPIAFSVTYNIREALIHSITI